MEKFLWKHFLLLQPDAWDVTNVLIGLRCIDQSGSENVKRKFKGRF